MMLVIEIDGGYHDETIEKDLERQRQIEGLGWTVIRFTDEDVENDAEAVGRAIADELGLPYEFDRRDGTGAGCRSVKAAKPKGMTPSPRLGSTLPGGG